MMLFDIAKFYGIIGRKKENEINLRTLCQTLFIYPLIVFQQILNTARDIAVNSHNPGFLRSLCSSRGKHIINKEIYLLISAVI